MQCCVHYHVITDNLTVFQMTTQRRNSEPCCENSASWRLSSRTPTSLHSWDAAPREVDIIINSFVVVTCAKFWPDQIIKIIITMKRILTRFNDELIGLHWNLPCFLSPYTLSVSCLLNLNLNLLWLFQSLCTWSWSTQHEAPYRLYSVVTACPGRPLRLTSTHPMPISHRCVNSHTVTCWHLPSRRRLVWTTLPHGM